MSSDSTRRQTYRHPTISRRTVLKTAGAVDLFATVPWSARPVRAVTGETPLDIPKWEDPLPRPGVLTPVSRQGGVERYDVPMTEFQQPVLPASMGLQTTVWGYAGAYPGPSIVARPGRPVEVTYRNQLPTSHLLSVDPRVHGAGDGAPEVRTAVHLHGGVSAPEFDGYPEAWVSPDGLTTDDIDSIPNSPVSYRGTMRYENEQEPATLWYHDHALGITRLNVYAGLAGFYLLRERVEDSLPSGAYEIPIVVQDRSFTDSGEWYYPDGTNDEFEAEFFGDVPVVNGKTYPFLAVEPRRYRFRFLNGSNGRTFNLRLRNDDTGTFGDVPLFQQIGVDLGFLEQVVTLGPDGDLPSMLLSGAERADVIVDFAGFEGTTFTLFNDAETPYAGENAGSDIPEIMQFRVSEPLTAPDESIPPAQFLRIIGRTIDRYDFEPPVTDSGVVRQLTLDTGAIEVEPGLYYDSHFLNNTVWTDENAVVRPTLNTTEVWELYNTTGDSHPIHLHLVDFAVVNRQGFDAEGFVEKRDAWLADPDATPEPNPGEFLKPGTIRQPNPVNRAKKDTVLVDPNEVIRIRPAFTGYSGRYVWHCHILEHEDQEMMLPYEVVDPTA